MVVYAKLETVASKKNDFTLVDCGCDIFSIPSSTINKLRRLKLTDIKNGGQKANIQITHEDNILLSLKIMAFISYCHTYTNFDICITTVQTCSKRVNCAMETEEAESMKLFVFIVKLIVE